MVLVSRLQGMRMCADGSWENVPAERALWELKSSGHQRLWDLRKFAAELRLSGFPRDHVGDRALLALVHNAIRLGDLVALREGKGQAVLGETIVLRRLVAKIQTETRGSLAYRGRQHKLVVDIDLATTPDRDSYEVVGQAEARALLDGLAKQSPASAESLQKASDKLTKDWRAPFSQPDGLILLRRIPVQAPAGKDLGPTITPSQMKALINDKEKIIDWTIWIELDPNDPKASDDVVILLDEFHQELMRKPLASCPRDGEGVLVTFEKIDKNAPFTLIRDYGPNEGGGQDTLFINFSPTEMDKRGSEAASRTGDGG
jgi:hypothetical protein